MKGYKECSNGHFYQESLDYCPHCPNPNAIQSQGNLDKTIADGTNFDDYTVADNSLDKTVIEVPKTTKTTPQKQQVDLSKTHIKTDEKASDETGTEKTVLRERRKLVGWLVSYTLDELGRDYRLYEGKNTIGTATSNDIILNTDSSVSAQHAVILFRNNTFYIKDNLSTNGTKVSEKNLEPDTAISFKDKSVIEIGDTLFWFRSSF